MRNQRTAAWLACALAVALAGCGGASGVKVGTAAYSTKTPKTLTVYLDLPLNGSARGIQTSIANGARLALDQSGHRVSYGPHGRGGSYHVEFRPRNDADQASGNWSQDLTAASAALASSQPTTVAYIGDFDSAATAISLPALSPSGILQVSPWSPYIGFTDANPADGKGDPARFYPPSGQTTFARLVPSDLAQAAATVAFMRSRGVTRLYVLGDVSVFDSAVAQLVANDAPKAGITLVTYQAGIDTQPNTQPAGYLQIATAVAAQRPDAVLLGATPGVGAIALWRELHTILPHAKLFAPSMLATPTFLRAIAAATGVCTTFGGKAVPCRSAAGATYVTSPILELSQYPARAKPVLRDYRRRFKIQPTAYALYGYEAMHDVLLAIQQAGSQATNRAKLLEIFFHRLGVLHGVIGDYTIDGNGDSSLQTFDGYRVSPGGALTLMQAIRRG